MPVVERHGNDALGNQRRWTGLDQNAFRAVPGGDADSFAFLHPQLFTVLDVDVRKVFGEKLHGPLVAGRSRLAMHIHLVGDGGKGPLGVLFRNDSASSLGSLGQTKRSPLPFASDGVNGRGELFIVQRDARYGLLLGAVFEEVFIAVLEDAAPHGHGADLTPDALIHEASELEEGIVLAHEGAFLVPGLGQLRIARQVGKAPHIVVLSLVQGMQASAGVLDGVLAEAGKLQVLG